ncbi:histone-lysine N-methyltransferase SETMAR [Trichonephila clavipes]|nr:histone-lysine N-methyltransferase SETMAR [Trichonephila clavipes]
MATVLWDRCGVLLVDFMPQGTTINSVANCATLRKLRRALQNKRCGMLSKGGLGPYSPDLAPSDLNLFRYLEHSFGGKHFSDNEEVKAAVNSNQEADFFEEGFQNLILRSCLASPAVTMYGISDVLKDSGIIVVDQALYCGTPGIIAVDGTEWNIS